MIRKARPTIEFIAKDGSPVRLIDEVPEYRAYRQMAGRWTRTKWGSCLPEGLQKFLEKEDVDWWK